MFLEIRKYKVNIFLETNYNFKSCTLGPKGNTTNFEFKNANTFPCFGFKKKKLRVKIVLKKC